MKMPGRIVGQCNRADFSSIEHIIASTGNIAEIDVSQWKPTQRIAVSFITEALNKGISYSMIREVVREVLVWGKDKDTGTGITVKFIQNKSHEHLKLIDEFKRLWK